jgi:hypothetical protein
MDEPLHGAASTMPGWWSMTLRLIQLCIELIIITEFSERDAPERNARERNAREHNARERGALSAMLEPSCNHEDSGIGLVCCRRCAVRCGTAQGRLGARILESVAPLSQLLPLWLRP